MSTIRRTLQIGLAALFLFAGAAVAQNFSHSAYLDLDDNPATGCSVATAAGAVSGIEVRLTATVSGQPPMVTAVTRETCGGALFGAPQAQPAGYPVGLNIGTGGADVVEWSTSLTGLGTGGPARIVFVSTSATGADIVVANGVFIQGTTATGFSTPALIPATGLLALLLLVGVVLWLARRHPGFGSSMALLLLLGVGVVWAANFVSDGAIGDWVGVSPRAIDASNDSTSGEGTIDLVAVFAETEAGSLFLRADVRDAQNQPPVANAQAVVVAEDGNIIITLTGSDPEAVALTFAIATNPARGALSAITPINATSASVTYTPTANENGADSFTFTVSDGTSTSVPATVSITITPVNDAPVVNAQTFPVVENGADGTVVGTATAVDPDIGQTLTWAITAGNTGNAFAINPATGQITVATSAAVIGTSFSLTVQATDNGVAPLSGSNTITINVTSVNDAPSFTAGPAQAVNEDAPAQSVPTWATAILAGPPDEAGQTLTFTVTNDNNALFAVQPAVAADGTLTYTLAANANGVANVAVFLMDNGGTAGGGVDTSPTQNFTITVTAVNDVPGFTAGPIQNVLQDAGPQIVTPWATALSAGPADEVAQTLTFNVTNNTNAALFSAGPAIAADGTLTYTPAAGVVGTADITLNVMDNGGTANGGVDTSATQVFTINVNNVNDAPTFTPPADPAAVLEDAAPVSLAGFIAGIDDADPPVVQVVSFNITVNSNAALFSAGPAIANDGTLSYTLAPNANGTANITFVAMDDGGTANGGNDTSAPDTFTITVTAVNDVPAFTAGPIQNVLQDAGPQIVTPWATALSAGPADEVAQTLTFNVTNNTNAALFSAGPAIAADGTLTYTPAAGVVGTADITLNVMDNGGTANGGVDTSATQVFTINVNNVNDAPTFTPPADPAAVLEDAAPVSLAGFIAGIDDADPPVVQVVSFNITVNSNAALFSAGPAIANDGTLSYTLAPNANGSADITFVAMDDGGTANGGSDTSAPDTFTITVTAVNDVPSFTAGPNQNVPQDSAAQVVNPWATGLSTGPADESGQTLAFAVTNNTNAALFSAGPAIAPDGSLTYTPAAGQVGTATITLQVADNGGTANGGIDTSATQDFTITLDDVNEAPVPTATPVSPIALPENSPAATLVTDIAPNDPDVGQTHTYTFQSGNTGNVFAVDAAGVITAVGALDFETLASYTLVVRVTDNGAPSLFADISITVNVTDVNEAPVVTAGGTLAYTEGDGAVVLNNTVTVTDPDAGEGLASATVQITGNLASAEDVLAFVNTANITGVYTAATGTLALTGADTPAAYQAALQSITYNNTSNDPSTGQRTVSWTVNDGALASNTATSTIDVTTVNSAPVPTATPVSPIAVPENSPAATVVTDIAPNDPEVGQTHTYAFQSGNIGNVFAVDAAGVITVVGAIDFETLASYTLVVRVTDNGAPSLFADISITVNVTDVNEAPAVTAGGTLAYTEGNGAVVLNNIVTVTDPDAGEGLASATVQITGNLASAEDVLAFVNTVNITGVYTAATGTLALTGADTPAAYQAALRTVTYSNTSNAPSTLQRTVSWTVNDGALASNTATSTIDVTTVNSAPVVTTSIGSTAYVENGPAVAIDAAVTATDADSANATSALVQITGGLQNAEDVLSFVNTASITGLYFPVTGELQLSGSDTLANYQLALRSVTYSNTSDAPNTGARTLSFSLIDDGAPGLASNVATKTVTVAAANDAPVVTLSGSTPSFTEGGAAVVVDGGVAVTDVDDTNMESATVTITNAFAGDVLTGTTGGGITVTGSGTTTLTLTGSATLAAYNAVLQGVTFSNGTDSPDPTARIVRFVANDGDVNSNNADKTVTVVAVNDAPVNAFPAAPATDEDTALTFTGANVISVADVDAGVGPMTVTLTATQGTIDADDTGGATIVNDGTAAVTLTGTLAQINATLDGTLFNPTLNFFGAASVTVQSSDNGNTGTGGALTDTDVIAITVNPVNDPPLADDETFDTLGNTELRIDLAAAATPHTIETTGTGFGVRDGDTDPVEGHAFTVTSIATCGDVVAPFDCVVGNLTITMNADGTFRVVPLPGLATGNPTSATFDYVITDDPLGVGTPATDTGTVTVNVFDKIWYVDAGAAGGGTGQSHSPLNSYTGINGAGGGGDGDGPGEIIFVHNDATTLIGSLELEANQRLWGEGFGLSLPNNLNGNGSPTVLVAAGTDAPVSGTDAVRVGNALPAEIRGLALTGTGGGNAIDISTTAALTGSATLTIDGNTINGAAAEGIDINFNTPTPGRAIVISNNSWNLAGTHTGNAIDIGNTNAAADTLRLNISNNTPILSATDGIVVNGGAAARTTITGFTDNSVHGNTGGAGVSISSVSFDATAGGAIQQVDGNNIAVGASGNPVGGNGLAVTNSQGDLFFDDMDVFAAGGGLTLSGVGSGLTFAVQPVGSGGTSSIDADNGPALNMNFAAIDLRLSSLQSDTTTSGVSIQSASGQFSAPAGSAITRIIGGGVAFLINGSSLTSDYAGSLNVTSGAGVSLTTNTGAMTFRGGMTLSTGANAAFSATGGGTVHVCDESPCNPAATGALVNSLTTTTGTALNVANTNIGANGLEFRSISAAGGANGIVLNTTGSSGGLRVNGDGANTSQGGNASGGTIGSMNGGDGAIAGSGMFLQDTAGVVLRRMTINGTHQNHGIRGFRVNGFILEHSTVNGTMGTSAAFDNYGEGAIMFGDDASAATNGLTGSATINNCIVGGGRSRNLSIVNTAGTLNRITVTNTSFGAVQNFVDAGDSLSFEARNAGTVLNATVTNSVFTAAPGDLVEFVSQTGTTMDVIAQNNTLSNNHAQNIIGGGGITIATQGAMTFNHSNVTARGAHGSALTLFKASAGTSFVGRVDNTDIGVTGVVNSGSVSGNGVFIVGAGTGTMTLALLNSQILRYSGNAGIYADNTGGTYDVNFTATSNRTAEPGAGVFAGLALTAGAPASADDIDVCAQIGGAGALLNDFATGDPANTNDAILGVSTGASSMVLPGYAGASLANVQTFVTTNNNVAGTVVTAYVDAPATAANFTNGAACPTPP